MSRWTWVGDLEAVHVRLPDHPQLHFLLLTLDNTLGENCYSDDDDKEYDNDKDTVDSDKEVDGFAEDLDDAGHAEVVDGETELELELGLEGEGD